MLADGNQPYYLHEFVASANAHGLAYLAEAQFSEMQVDVLPPALQPVLAEIADPVRRERVARRPQGAQVPPDAPVPRGPPARSRAEARAAGRDGGVGTLRWTARRGERSRDLPRARHRARRVRPPARRAHAAGDRRQLAVAGRDRRARARSASCRRSTTSCCAATPRTSSGCTSTPRGSARSRPDRPRISPVARLRSGRGHDGDDRPPHASRARRRRRRAGGTLLDGRRDRAALVEAIGDPAAAMGREELAEGLEHSLQRLAGAGLLLPDDAPAA